MENNLKNIINKYKAKKITLKNSAKIIENENTRLVIKKDNPNILDTYNYLLSRSFDYFPKIIYKDNDYNVYEYVEDVNEPSEQRILDIITLTSILHSKTTFYKEVDIDNYKYLYETINKRCIIHTESGETYKICASISELKGKLGPSFYQTHQSCLVNVEKIKWVNYNKNLIVFNNNTELYLLSNRNRKGLKEYVTSY